MIYYDHSISKDNQEEIEEFEQFLANLKIRFYARITSYVCTI